MKAARTIKISSVLFQDLEHLKDGDGRKTKQPYRTDAKTGKGAKSYFRNFLKKALTTSVSLCYSIVAMEEVFFLCLKLILQEKNGGGSCARKDHISMYRMQTA
jgi:hypothetical protein